MRQRGELFCGAAAHGSGGKTYGTHSVKPGRAPCARGEKCAIRFLDFREMRGYTWRGRIRWGIVQR